METQLWGVVSHFTVSLAGRPVFASVARLMEEIYGFFLFCFLPSALWWSESDTPALLLR